MRGFLIGKSVFLSREMAVSGSERVGLGLSAARVLAMDGGWISLGLALPDAA
jgi:hypothetical protein